jgi:hypothetical protein
LPTRKRHGKEPLVDCSNSDVVTLDQYMVMLKQKTLKKEIVDKIREHETKEREEKRLRQVEHTLT